MTDPTQTGSAGPRDVRRNQAFRLVAQMAGLVLVLLMISLAIGPVGLSVGDVFSGLFGGADEPTNIIVQDIRLPRTALALLIGATLGLAGAALQGLLRSPLAAPSLLGAPSAAAFTAVTAIAVGLVGFLSAAMPIAAIVGAFTSVGLLLLVAGPRASLLVLILAGLAVSALAAAGTALAFNLAPARLDDIEISFWLLGSLENRSIQDVVIALPFMALSWILLSWDRSALRALTIGEEAAEGLGINVKAVRQRVVLGVAVGVGAAVAVAGAIGFVGLVAPQLMRPFVNHDPARVLLPAALSGAALLLVSDIVVRLVPSSAEIKIGIVTALVGAPVFIFLIMQHRRGLVGAPM